MSINSTCRIHSGVKLFYFIIIQLLVNHAYGQYGETIRTGRPGQAIGAYTVGKNILQLQQGFDYYSLANVKFPPKGFISTNIIRYGLTSNFEISTLIDYQLERTEFENSTTTLSGLSNMHFGFRGHINDQKGWLPTMGFQVRLKMPGISTDFGINNIAPVMVLVANWSLPKNMNLGTNWILSYNGSDPNATGKYVVNFGFPIYKKWSGFIENYGQINQSEFQTRFDGGFAYLVNNNILLDFSAGYGQNQNTQDYFVSTGISYRFLDFRRNKTL